MTALPYAPDNVAPNRPRVSDVQDGPIGPCFTVQFGPGQVLPSHRNSSVVVLTAIEGDGEITIAGDGIRSLPRGAVVQLDPNVEHAIAASERGLELRVDLIASCCSRC